MIRIIANRKVDLTDDEWTLYNKICLSYSAYGGAGLFDDLFESDNNGIIVFLKPPSKKHTTFEVFLFLMAVLEQQHMRLMHNQIDDAVVQIKNKLAELDAKIQKLSENK
jgi:hypothetical protein